MTTHATIPTHAAMRRPTKSFNILAFHAFLAPSGIGPGLALTVLEIYLDWTYRTAYRPLLATRAPVGAE
jgi:hypothetical protein